MLRITPSCPVYLAVGATDLRNNIDGLLLKIKYQFELDPFNNLLKRRFMRLEMEICMQRKPQLH